MSILGNSIRADIFLRITAVIDVLFRTAYNFRQSQQFRHSDQLIAFRHQLRNQHGQTFRILLPRMKEQNAAVLHGRQCLYRVGFADIPLDNRQITNRRDTFLHLLVRLACMG